MKYNKIMQWVLPAIFAVIGLIMFIIYVCLHDIVPLTVLQFFSCMAVPFIVPVLGLIVKREFSLSLTFNLGVLIFFGIYVERVFGVYSRFPAYDKILHTNFGLIGAAMVYALLLRWRGDKMTHAGVIFTLIMVALGLGGAWELFEYSSALFTGQDPQVWHAVVNSSIEAGEIVGNPMKDTMEDMLVTLIGASAFCILYLVDVCTGCNLFKKFFGEVTSPSGVLNACAEAEPLANQTE